MTDRCATNASFVEQLKSWRNEVLPTVIDNFDDMLFEISKLCSYTHGDQRNGKAKEWRAYLANNNLPNKITVKPQKEEPGKLRTNRLFLKILYPLVKNQCQGVFE